MQSNAGTTARLLNGLLLMLCCASGTVLSQELSLTPQPPERVKSFLADIIGHPPERRLELAIATLQQSDAALASQPLDATHHLLKVAALGTAARASTPGQSLKARYGSKSKMAVNDMLAIVPEEPWALFFAGVWNMEVVRRGGPVGSVLLGGSMQEGEKLLSEAMQKLPREPVFPFAYAVVLLSMDATKHGKQAHGLLEQALRLAGESPESALRTAIELQTGKIVLALTHEQFNEAHEFALQVM